MKGQGAILRFLFVRIERVRILFVRIEKVRISFEFLSKLLVAANASKLARR